MDTFCAIIEKILKEVCNYEANRITTIYTNVD